MKDIITLLNCLYARLVRLYPAAFQAEFEKEMTDTFRVSVEEAGTEGILSLARVCLRGIVHLPASLVSEFRHVFERKEMNMATIENLVSQPKPDERTGHWDGLMGTLPFALFGIASILSRTQYPINAYFYLAFYAAVLVGLLAGMIKGFPRRAYHYLGWSLVFT